MFIFLHFYAIIFSCGSIENMKVNGKIKKLYIEINDFMKLARKNKVSVYSACASFYIFMSFIPFAIIAMALVPYMPFTQNDVLGIVTSVVPEGYSFFFISLIEDLYAYSRTALSVSILVTIWSSAKGVLGITQGLNEINGVDETRNFITVRIRSAVYTLALMAGMLLLLIISVFGNTIVKITGHYIDIPETIINILGFVHIFMLVVLFLMFLFFLCVLPAKKIKIRSQLPGAFGSAFLWWLFTRLFSYYVSEFDGYSMYGSFAILMILGVWLYTGMYIMFMGAQYNYYRALRKGNK